MQERQAFTVVVEIDPDRLAHLRELLAVVNADPGGNALCPLAHAGTTHFASFAILDNQPAYPPLLVFDAAHDGTRTAWLTALAAAGEGLSGLARLFACTRGYPGPDGLVAWLLTHVHRASGAHLGYPGRTVRGVNNDRAVHAALRALLDSPAGAPLRGSGLRPNQLRRELWAALRRDDAAAPTRTTGPPVPTSALLRAVRVLGQAPAVIGAAVALFVLAFMLRRQEKRDVFEDYTAPPPPPLRPADVVEDLYPQNQLTHLVEIRPGWLRMTALRLVLFVVDRLSRFYFTDGTLNGIPTIHFARWVILPHGPAPRLLFLSNYDLSWDSYLSDFIDRAHSGLTGVWSHTRGFPATRYIIKDGARYDEAFKAWTRQHQLPAQVWYTSRPDMTVASVQNSCAVRAGLEPEAKNQKSQVWLTRI